MKLLTAIAVVISCFAAGSAGADRVNPRGLASESPQVAPVPPPPSRVAVASPETSKLGAAVAGSYSCKGVQLEADGSSRPMRGRLTIKLEPDFGWIQSTFVQELPSAFKIADFRSYDHVSKQWTRLRLTSASAHETATSLGEQNGIWTWSGIESSSIGTMQQRDHEQISKTSLKLWGEAMLGGTWEKQYEVTCTR
jgi:hypothetical protein